MTPRWLDLGAVGLATIVVVAAGLALRTEATDVLPAGLRPTGTSAGPVPTPSALPGIERRRKQAPHLVSPDPNPVAGQSTVPSISPSPTPVTASPVDPPSTTGIGAATGAPASVLSEPPFDKLIVTVKKDAVIGIRLDQAITTETARVDDKVTARVARDVVADGRTAIPAGTRFEGLVTLVERGAHGRDRGKLGIRFNLLVLPDNSSVSIHTDAIFRDGDAIGEPSAAMGASAALGALLSSSGRQAAPNPISAAPALTTIRRNEAMIPAGSLLTVKLTAPLSVVIERDPLA
jgi:hypothetical protein